MNLAVTSGTTYIIQLNYSNFRDKNIIIIDNGALTIYIGFYFCLNFVRTW